MSGYAPEIGTIVRDSRKDKVGRVMGHVGGRVQLRPLAGGLEWDARLADLAPVPLFEALGPAVAAANARSRGETA